MSTEDCSSAQKFTNISRIAQLDNKTDKIEGPQMLLKEIDQALEVSVKYESQLKDYFMKKQFAPISKKMAMLEHF